MRSLRFAATLDFRDPEALSRVRDAFAEWVGSRGLPALRLEIDRDDRQRTEDGQLVRWQPYREGNRALLELVWRHFDPGSRSVSWTHRAAFVEAGGIRRLVLTSEASDSAATGTPSLTDLIALVTRRMDAWCGDVALELRARALPGDEAMPFAQFMLTDPGRVQPIVLLSPHEDGTYAVDPDVLARELLTLGQVYVFPTPADSFGLTDALGKEWSCFLGAIRVYRPGFSRADDPRRHPLLFPERVVDVGVRAGLWADLAVAQAQGFKRDPLLGALREERALLAERRSAQFLADLDRRLGGESGDVNWRQIVESLLQENRDLLARVEDTRQRIVELEEELARAEPFDEPLGRPSESVLAVVERATREFKQDLVFLPSATRSAADSPFRRPDEIFQALETMARLAARKRQGDLAGGLFEAFRDAGQDYATGASDGTSKRLRAQRRFTVAGTTHDCFEHLRIGGGTYDPALIARIYFTSSGLPDGRWVVGHVGRHLDVMTTS